MLVPITLLIVLLTGFIFLPTTYPLLGISISDDTHVGVILRTLLNVRYKLISLLHLSRPLHTGYIDEIYVYPFKSVSFLKVKEWEIDEHGFKHDRQFMAAYWDDKAQLYQPYTLRNIPRFALVKMTYNLKENWFQFTYPILDAQGNNLRNVYKSFRLPCEVSREFIEANLTETDSKVTNLWDIHFDSYSIGKALPQDFRDSMKMTRAGTTLLYTSKGKLVKTGSPDELQGNLRTTHFQDYYPLMLMSNDEISEVNKRMKEAGYTRQVESVQFRPNLVVAGLNKTIDDVYKFRIREAESDKVHNWATAQKCPRCSIPNVDLKTGAFDKKNAVSKTLKGYRSIDAGDVKSHFLGLYCVHIDHGYTVKVGDKFDIMEEQVRLYLGLH